MEEKKQQSQDTKQTDQNKMPEKLPEEIEKIINFLPEDKKEEALKVITSLSIETSSAFRGPLPPPSVLADYNDIINNGAERIMKMAENQSGHRIELEKHAIKEELKQSRNGQIFGFILAVFGIIAAFVLAYLDHDTVAGIFGTTTIVGLVTIFVIGKKRQTKEQAE